MSSFSTNEYKKITARPMEVKGQPVLQLEKFTETQAFHENLPMEQANHRLEGLMEQYGQLDATCQGAVFCIKISKKGKLFFQKQAAKTLSPLPAAHNRQKQYLITEGMIVPPLVDLGVLTPDGRIVKAKYDKFKQINRFLEFLDDLLAKDSRDTVRIIDFGCGKSYLTFVVYYYITEILHKKADIAGLDLKKDVIDHCNQVAEKYGYDGLKFYWGDIKDYVAQQAPDMVITLHACDTATDFALYNAIQWNTKMIFSVPCCQHELNHQMKAQSLSILSNYGIIQERFAALATDAIRGNLLEYSGYKTQLLEFIDFAHTPKNILIRAIRRQNTPEKHKKAKLDEVHRIMDEFQFAPTLYKLISPETVK